MIDVSLDSFVVRHPELVFAHMGDEVVMMSQDQSDYLGLNVVASVIWELAETPLQVSAICTQLQQRFEVTPERCEQDVLAFMQQMLERDLVQIAER